MRSENFDMTAFKNLPLWEDFVKGRGGEMLHKRLAFTRKLQEMHERTLARYASMKTLADEQAVHERWDEEQAKKPKRHKPQGPARPCPACCAAK